MNLSLQDYIETELFPKLSHHVKYSDFFEKQYDYFRNDISAIYDKNNSIAFYTWRKEYEEFDELVKTEKLIYKNKIVGKGDKDWEYLIEYSTYFEKGFNSIDSNSPISTILNHIPFCSTQNCMDKSNHKNRVVAIGRKVANSYPCLVGMRPPAFLDGFGQGILRSKKINNVTNQRELAIPNKTAFSDGVMFKSIFISIERYSELQDYFEFPRKTDQQFVETLLRGIKRLQNQDEKAECIRQIKKHNKPNESLFRDWFETFLSAKYEFVNCEPEKGYGRIDLKVEDPKLGSKIIEFKGWWNEDMPNVVNQISGYLTDFEEDGYIVLINKNKKKITDDYLSIIKSDRLGYIKDSLEVKKDKNSNYNYYITKHSDDIRVRSINHLIINVY